MNRLKYQSDKIKYLEGNSNYTILHLVDKSQIVLSYTLNKVQDMINADFIRIHKGIAINSKYIKQYTSSDIELVGGVHFSVSRRRKKQVQLYLDATPCKKSSSLYC